MENASKALIIAGGLLISILTIGIITNFYRQSADLAVSIDQRTVNDSIKRYNEEFTKFTSMEKISVYDIVSVINYAKNLNMRLYDYDEIVKKHENGTYDFDENYDYIRVCVNVGPHINKDDVAYNFTQQDLHDFINDYQNVTYYGSNVVIGYNNNTGKVNYIFFKK